jgi:hypothetical protein
MATHGSSTYLETLQNYADVYFAETGKERATTRELAVWAIRTRRWEPPSDLIIRKCREDFAKALREQYFKNDHGRPVRAKHAARVTEGDRQLTFWADIRIAPRTHMAVAFQQRREQIVGECRQLSRDVGYYNEHRPDTQPIQPCFDFRDDIEEGEFSGEYPS